MKTITRSNFIFGYKLSLALSMIIIYSGCSNSSGSGPASVSWHIAQSGSEFIFKDYTLDSLGNPGAPREETDYIQSSGLSIGGKSNVSEVLESSGGNNFSFYIYYAPNGDFFLGDSSYSLPGGIDWIDFPTGSQKTTVVNDTSYVDTLNHSQGKEYSAISYQGYETVYVAGKNFQAIKIKIESDYSYSSVNDNESSSETEYIWFAPEIGYIVKAESHMTDTYTYSSGITSTIHSGGEYILDSYTLK